MFVSMFKTTFLHLHSVSKITMYFVDGNNGCRLYGNRIVSAWRNAIKLLHDATLQWESSFFAPTQTELRLIKFSNVRNEGISSMQFSLSLSLSFIFYSRLPFIPLLVSRWSLEDQKRKRFFKVAGHFRFKSVFPARGLDVRALTSRGTAFLVRY